jgi:hypothetical protein
MSVANFNRLVHDAKLSKADKEWFPRWVRRYASGVEVVEDRLSVSQDEVIDFLRSLLKSNTPAWQRLQAVRAIEAYRDLVLQTGVPPLGHIRQKLSRLADQERAGTDRPGIRDERHLIGPIDPNEPEIIQQMRRELRVRGKMLDTERTYVSWVQRFIHHCGSDDIRTNLAKNSITPMDRRFPAPAGRGAADRRAGALAPRVLIPRPSRGSPAGCIGSR